MNSGAGSLPKLCLNGRHNSSEGKWLPTRKVMLRLGEHGSTISKFYLIKILLESHICNFGQWEYLRVYCSVYKYAWNSPLPGQSPVRFTVYLVGTLFQFLVQNYAKLRPSSAPEHFLPTDPVAMVHQFGPNLNRFVVVRKLGVSRVPMAWWFWRENHDTGHDLRVLLVDVGSAMQWEVHFGLAKISCTKMADDHYWCPLI